MKYLTFVVPSYNSQDYLARCVDTLLAGGEDVEIIIVNDGSTDATAAIADGYAAAHPTIVKVVHQENKGHGGAVNAGLAQATGRYLKVVDSDDWLDVRGLISVLFQMKNWEEKQQTVDMIVCNYVYDHLFDQKQHTVDYRNVFDTNQICGWEGIGRFNPSQYLIMHALIFKTEILRKSGVELPLNTFYVDNLFAYQPLPYVKNICYLDVDLYHYFIGRDDQSINESVMMERIDQQIKVTKIVSECTNLADVEVSKLSTYMMRNISIMLAISSIHLLLIGTDEALAKRKELWNYIKTINRKLYWKLRLRTVGGLTYLPGKIGSLATVTGYRAAKTVIKFQ
ncbi:MAG: glycosyltransferase family 2 protein [Enterococcus sp.]